MNTIILIGNVQEFEFDYEYKREKFFRNVMSIERTNGSVDRIQIIASERTEAILSDFNYEKVKVIGEIRTRHCEGKLEVYVFVRYIEESSEEDGNYTELEGYLCNSPKVRDTPLGRRIADVIFAVNRVNGKADYIPVIFWGRSADAVSQLNIGSNLVVYGRLQSREYAKDDCVYTVYEVSASEYRKIE